MDQRLDAASAVVVLQINIHGNEGWFVGCVLPAQPCLDFLCLIDAIALQKEGFAGAVNVEQEGKIHTFIRFEPADYISHIALQSGSLGFAEILFLLDVDFSRLLILLFMLCCFCGQ